MYHALDDNMLAAGRIVEDGCLQVGQISDDTSWALKLDQSGKSFGKKRTGRM